MDVFDEASDDEGSDHTGAAAAAILRHVFGAPRVAIGETSTAWEREAVAALALAVGGRACDTNPNVVIATSARGVRMRRGGALAVLDESRPIECEKETRHGPWTVHSRRAIVADPQGCSPWGPPSDAEHDRVEACCVPAARVGAAARILSDRGLVVLPGLVMPAVAAALGAEALENFEACRRALAAQDIDLLRPHDSRREPVSYRELAMREDCRCDVRLPLRTRVDLEAAEGIARLAAASPASPLRAGNYGRWNFEGKGPLAPPAPLVVGELAAIVSLPGAAEQALHADVPHLVDHVQLPGQAFNLFVAVGDHHDLAGQTAFVVGSHDLATCADLTRDDRVAKLVDRIVRPRLQPGDALLFDARILHFGLPNRSPDCRRAIVYANIHAPWFRDRKNWDDRRSIFGGDSSPRSPEGATIALSPRTGGHHHS